MPAPSRPRAPLTHGANGHTRLWQDTWETPLHWAAAGGRVDVAKALLAGGADKYRLDAAGRAPLAHAEEYGQREVASLLRGACGGRGLGEWRSDLTDIPGADMPGPPRGVWVREFTSASAALSWTPPAENASGAPTLEYTVEWVVRSFQPARGASVQPVAEVDLEEELQRVSRTGAGAHSLRAFLECVQSHSDAPC